MFKENRDYAQLLCDSVLAPYVVIKSSSVEMEALGFFLTDINGTADDIKDWIFSNPVNTTSTNLYWLAKEGQTVLLGDMHDETEELVFRFPQEQFLAILDQWDDLYKKKAPEILLYQEGDRIWLEGK